MPHGTSQLYALGSVAALLYTECRKHSVYKSRSHLPSCRITYTSTQLLDFNLVELHGTQPLTTETASLSIIISVLIIITPVLA